MKIDKALSLLAIAFASQIVIRKRWMLTEESKRKADNAKRHAEAEQRKRDDLGR